MEVRDALSSHGSICVELSVGNIKKEVRLPNDEMDQYNEDVPYEDIDIENISIKNENVNENDNSTIDHMGNKAQYCVTLRDTHTDTQKSINNCQKKSIENILLIKAASTNIDNKVFEYTRHCENIENRDFNGQLSAYSNKRLFQCSQCKKSFKSNKNLITHKRIHTGEKPYKCSECKKAFCQISGLDQHTRIHTGEKPFECFKCDKAFRQSSGLKQHMRTHTGEKPFTCSHCDKTFRQSSGLNQHLLIHSGEKPFACLECHKKYRQSSGLNKHMLSHKREKLPQLVHNETFSQMNYLSESHHSDHLVTQTNIKILECPQCNQLFNKRKCLSRHLRHVHNVRKPVS